MLDRLKSLVLKPGTVTSSDHIPTDEAMSPDELEHAFRFSSDKERLIGLIAAPIAALLDIVVIRTLIHDDPPQHVKGALNPRYVNLSEYHTLFFVLFAIAIGMLATAWWRKRTFNAIATALFGLGLFNLHYYGFGAPFILVAAWLLVRAYRIQRDYRATLPNGGRPAGSASAATASHSPPTAAPPPTRGAAKAGRRYTAR